MKRILNIIFRPAEEISLICEEEPVFNGLLFFIVAVLIGNFEIVKSFFLNWQTGIFHSAMLVFMWAGVLLIVNLIIVGVMKLIDPLTSGVLNSERFKKLFIVESHLSLILIFRPILNIFLDNKLSWAIIFIWGIILVFIAVAFLWSVVARKSILSVGVAVVLVWIGFRQLDVVSRYTWTDDYEQLNSLLQQKLPQVDVNLLGWITPPVADKDHIKLLEAVDDFIRQNPASPAIPYCILIKAKVEYQAGALEKSKNLYMQLINFKDVPKNIVNTARLNLKYLLDDSSFALLIDDFDAGRWKSILNFYNIDINLSNLKDNISRVAVIKDIIAGGNLDLVEEWLKTTGGGDFYDDMYYWMAERAKKDEDFPRAIRYYEKALDSQDLQDKARLKIESVMRDIEENIDEVSILDERFVPPFALLSLGNLHRKLNNTPEAKDAYEELLVLYPDHSVSAEALLHLALYSEEEADFITAVKFYDNLIKNYPQSILVTQASFKKDIIEDNLDNQQLLTAYSDGWKKWRQGNYSEAIKIYKNLIDEFPASEIASELQYNIADYYRRNLKFMQAIHEYKIGYSKFKDSPRGFDFGVQIGNVLADDLRYYRRAVNWFQKLRDDYGPDYKAPISGITSLDIAWRMAEISKKFLRDYRNAIDIYNSIIKSYTEDEVVAKAMYEKTLIDEKIYRRYVKAVSEYKEIVSRFPDSPFAEKARKRMENLYVRGVKLLERYR